MQIAAKLTIGWPDIPRWQSTAGRGPQFAAGGLHTRALAAPHYEKSLLSQLKSASERTHILGLDQLFRRTCGGFTPIDQFVSALISLPPLANTASPLICEIDLFAYTFLAGTYRLDRTLPIARTHNLELAQIQQGCTEALQALEDFELTGQLPAEMGELDAQQYLTIRRVVAQESAKNEWRILASLLISGPSTATNLERELGIAPRPLQQTLHLLESIGIFTRWGEEPGSSSDEPIFVIEKVAIPLVLFCLKETIGIDPLRNLSDLLDTLYE